MLKDLFLKMYYFLQKFSFRFRNFKAIETQWFISQYKWKSLKKVCQKKIEVNEFLWRKKLMLKLYRYSLSEIKIENTKYYY